MQSTHIGILEGVDNRTRSQKPRRVELRETKLYWVTNWGQKFHKKDGRGTGDFPMYRLQLNSVKTK